MTTPKITPTPANKVIEVGVPTNYFFDFSSGAVLEVSYDGGSSFSAWDLSSTVGYPLIQVLMPTCVFRVTLETVLKPLQN